MAQLLKKVEAGFPEYSRILFHLTYLNYLVLGFVSVISIISVWIYYWFVKLQKTRKVPYVYLEVKPTDRTLKSPLSTTQLFTSIHSLITPFSSGLIFNIKRSISFELVSTKDQGIRFILRIPKGVDTIIYKNLLAYLPGIEVNYVDDYLGIKLLAEPNISRKLLRQELQFKHSYLHPLKTQDVLNQFDPIAFTTAHMTKLLDGEMVSVQFISTPISDITNYSVSKVVKEVQERLSNNQDISDLIKKTEQGSIFEGVEWIIKIVWNIVCFLFKQVWEWIYTYLIDPKSKTKSFDVFPKATLKPIHELGLNKQQKYQKIGEKISEPLFETVIRMEVVSSSRENAEQRLQGLFSSFETFNSQDQKFKKHTPFFWEFQHSLIQKLLTIELIDRFSLFGNGLVLSASELSSMYHLPYTLTTKTEDLLQVKSPQLPAPLSLKQSSTELDIIFASNTFGNSTTQIGQILELRRRHTYISGATGTGKSTLMLQMIYQDMVNGKGMCIIDPHGDMAERLIGIIPKERVKDVIYWDPSDLEYPIGLNILKLPKSLSKFDLAKEKTRIVSALIGIFHKLYPERYSGPRMEHLLRNLVLTALTIKNPNLETLYNLLTDYGFRKPIIDSLKDPLIKRFWKKEFSKLGSYQQADMVGPITNKLSAFLTTAFTREIVLQTEKTLSLEDIMNSKKILICNFSKGNLGDDNLYFLGGLLVAEIQRAAMRRIKISEDERVDFYLYIDEFQNFATKSFEEIISEARKYRLNLVIAHQNTTQLDKDTFDSIIANCGTTICFRSNSPIDEDRLLPLFKAKVEEGQLQNLPSYTFYIKISAISPQNPFTGEIKKFDIQEDIETRKAVIKHSQDVYGSEPIKIDDGEIFITKTPKKTQKLFQRRSNKDGKS